MLQSAICAAAGAANMCGAIIPSPRILAPLDTLQERSIAAPGLLAAVIVGKYVDHLPLYRQEQIFLTGHRVSLPRQCMAR